MFNPGWKMTIFTLTFAPLLFGLGQWQLGREQEKIQLQIIYESRMKVPAVEIDEIDWSQADLNFVKVKASGRFESERVYLLDNKIHEGKVGYEIIDPFVTDSGQTVLVNRGWIAQGASRSELPPIPLLEGKVEIEGSIYIPLDDSFY